MKSKNIANEILGFSGRLISGSKSLYRNHNLNNIIIFNANLCTEEEKFWYGDIDINKDYKLLQLLAHRIGKTIYILNEIDGRFENENKPLINNFIARFDVCNNITFNGYYINSTMMNYFIQIDFKNNSSFNIYRINTSNHENT